MKRKAGRNVYLLAALFVAIAALVFVAVTPEGQFLLSKLLGP